MHTFLVVIVILMMLATVGVLFAGLFGMVRGNDGEASNRLMRWRVVLQGGTIVLFAILLGLLRH